MQPHAIMLRITAYTAARLTTRLALRNAQTNIGRRLRLGFEPGRQCPIRLTEGDLNCDPRNLWKRIEFGKKVISGHIVGVVQLRRGSQTGIAARC